MSTQTKESFNYFPLQPHVKSIAAQYVEARGYPNHNVLLFSQFTIGDVINSPAHVLPDGCIEIIFSCNPNNPTASIYGSLFKDSRKIFFEPGYEHFCVRVLVEQGAKLIKYPMNEIREEKLPLLDLVSMDNFIVEKICEPSSFHERINYFLKFIKNNLENEHIAPYFIDYAVKRIYRCKGNITVGDLAKEIGYSDRYLRQQFKKHLGINPKELCQIVRFQNSICAISNLPHDELIHIVSDLGYYDQSHFIDEIKRFSQLTPIKLKETLV
ncbi:MAG TPA: helix-turn-helix domain-containing protein [Bacillota bacterium]|nr:helix-turn-helix domain-containing protein [Bacillota bacterium]